MTTELKSLYDQKQTALDSMRGLATKAKSGELSADEQRKFEGLENEVTSLNSRIKVVQSVEQREADAVARDGKHVSGNGEGRDNDNSSKYEFRDRKGVDVPVFTIGKQAPKENGSITDWYYRNHNVDKSLENISAGELVRAYLGGPQSKAEERALSEGVDAQGGYTVPDVIAAKFYDDIRAKSHVFRAGTQTVLLDSNSHAFAKITGDPTASWIAEGGAITASDITIGTIPFVAKSLKAKVIASGELLQDSLNIGQVINASMVGAFSNEIDRVALEGAGTATEPKGIYNYTSPSTYSMGANGAAITDFTFLIEAVKAMLNNNCPIPKHLILNVREWATITSLVATDGHPLLPPFNLAELVYDSQGLHETSKTSVTQTMGTAVNSSSMYLGGFQNLFYGLRLGLKIIPTHELVSTNYQYSFLAVARGDFQPRREADFGVVKGIIP